MDVANGTSQTTSKEEALNLNYSVFGTGTIIPPIFFFSPPSVFVRANGHSPLLIPDL
ncbi:MAG: hypothetical protein F6K23_06220 [Okeania sp. SIO2C9]|uniref:hypothetical protein n=1 Tax=Okeania sp. SIO2C9 TaxID=2607791 RepID=UPI0013C0514B|nr:hypothetical protein [Okeania sp. SIO2C9]NEQ72703.1 hypothetical protein [Okeania sp. SIO2C9]